ncbi:MAG: hypothetical protein M9897_05935 [Brumimicrobium sp.]|nr:hypothetical protein [Brumimicrobium sp.]
MKYISIITLFLISFSSFSQIITEGNSSPVQEETSKSEKSVKVKKEKVKREKSGIELYVGFTPSYTYRTLKVNEGLFGEPLGMKSDEKGVWTTGYFLGVRNPLSKSFKLDIGIGYSSNKERFSYASSDSLYKYTNSYRHIAVPLKIAYTYGENIKLYAGAGIIPRAFLSMKRELTTFDKYKNEQTEKFIIRDKFNFILIDAVVDLGVQFKIGKNAGVFIMGEASRQLNNNYVKQGPYIRKSWAVGLNCGIEIYL